MSRLRQAFHVFWYLSRWPHLARMLFIVACGLFLVGGGAIVLTRPHLPDRPERLSFNEVMGLLEQPSPRYVTFEAGLDFSKKIYRTGWVPYWGHCPPAKVQPLPPPDAPDGELVALLGCRVTLGGSITPGRIVRLTREAGEDGQAAQREQRHLAEIAGTKGRIWVLSGTFKEGDPREKQWLGKTDFAGVLATHEQTMNGLPAGFPRRISPGAPSRTETFVIHDGSDAHLDEKTREHFSSHYWVPVKGSGNSIFVWATPEIETSFTGSVTGVLEPRDRSDHRTRNKGYAHFSVVTREALPARFGVVQYRTAKQYNDAEIGVGWPIVLFGSLMAGAGLLGLIVYLAAPGIIFDAWKRAIESVRERRRP